jgi:acetate kinase
MKVLVVNVGSTSLKLRLFDMAEEKVLASGRVERVGSAASPASFQIAGGPREERQLVCPDARSAIRQGLEALVGPGRPLASLDELDAVGFKPVHAQGIADTVVIDEATIRAMERYTPLAPVHNPPYIAAFRIFAELVPGKPLVGMFEPAFHRTIPEYARTYAIPAAWAERHSIRRYGFHGASHRWVSERVPAMLGRRKEDLRIISCHLGGSSSLCAIRGGVSIDTSMGFSPQSGLPHATRCGDLDPFVILYLLTEEGMTPADLGRELTSQGGLKGISGVGGGDVRDLEEAAAGGNQRAALALSVLVYETKKYIGAFAAALSGIDALAFTGGIGENAAGLRARICDGLEFLGVRLDPARNQAVRGEGFLSPDGAAVQTVALVANEELVIARATARILGGAASARLTGA